MKEILLSLILVASIAQAEEFSCNIITPESTNLMHSQNGVLTTQADGWTITVLDQTISVYTTMDSANSTNATNTGGVMYTTTQSKGEISFTGTTAEGLPLTIDGTGFVCCPDSVGMNCAINSVPK